MGTLFTPRCTSTLGEMLGVEATEQELDKIIAAVLRESRPLKGANNIGMRVGKVINRFKVDKHFYTEITDNNFRYYRLTDKIAAEEKLDGIYVIRTSVAASRLKAPEKGSLPIGLSFLGVFSPTTSV